MGSRAKQEKAARNAKAAMRYALSDEQQKERRKRRRVAQADRAHAIEQAFQAGERWRRPWPKPGLYGRLTNREVKEVSNKWLRRDPSSSTSG